ncbi:hypothetical protein [Roseobacter phage RDJL6]|nr:hypothetical protein [Roseobacter phage RDJL6]
MSQFAHLKKMEVQGGKTAEFKMHALEGTPVLTVKPAMESNKAYFNASLKASRSNMRSIRNGNVTAGLLDETRETDRELYGKHIIVGWNNVLDSSGKSVPFDRSVASDFLEALPNWLFDELREFCGTPSNFIEDHQVDTEAVAKNSKSV